MGKRNVITKQYIKENSRFADLCNFYLYDGKAVIKPDNLSELDVTELALPKGMGGTLAVEKVRDILKSCCLKVSDGVMYLIIGIENQTDIHYAMVIRNMLYDALNYTSQVSEYSRKHKRAKDLAGDEFLSGFGREDKLLPIITLTVFWNSGKWDGARSLHDMLLVKDRRLLAFVPDYKLNLIIPEEIADFDKFQTELGSVLEFICCADSGKKMKQVLQKRNKELKELSEEAMLLLNTCVDTNLKIVAGKGADENVCKAIEELVAEGKAEGAIQMLFRLVSEGLLSLSAAAVQANMTEEEFEAQLHTAVEKKNVN